MKHYLDFYFYKFCVYNKIKKISNKNLAKRSNYPIEYIYTNIARFLLIASYN